MCTGYALWNRVITASITYIPKAYNCLNGSTAWMRARTDLHMLSVLTDYITHAWKEFVLLQWPRIVWTQKLALKNLRTSICSHFWHPLPCRKGQSPSSSCCLLILFGWVMKEITPGGNPVKSPNLKPHRMVFLLNKECGYFFFPSSALLIRSEFISHREIFF